MNLMKVKFDYQPCHVNDNIVYKQPLYYIGMNIAQMLYKHSNSPSYKSELLNEKFKFDLTNVSMDFVQLLSNSKNNSYNISYNLSKYFSEFNFSYDGVNYELNTIKNCDNFPVKDSVCGETFIYSIYEISFPRKDFTLFEDFINDSVKFYKKYYNEEEQNGNEFKIYLSSSEGNYFERLGKRQKRAMESIYLPSKQKHAIINDLTKFLKPETKERYFRLGINYKRTYLFEGVPGAGKTSFIMALASHFNYNIAIITFSPKMTDNGLIRLLHSLQFDENDKRCFIVFEDMDCIFKERKTHDEQKNMVTFSGLLNILDGISTSSNMISFITTNYKANLDSALIRPGRVDYIMKFDYATKEQISDIFKAYMWETQEEALASEAASKVNEFYTKIISYNIKITTSLLQQYLLKYLNSPDEAISNLDELEKMYESSNISKEAEETGMYS